MIARAVQDAVPHEVCARLCAGAAIAANEALEKEMLKIGMSMLFFFFNTRETNGVSETCLISTTICCCVCAFIALSYSFCLSSVITLRSTNCQSPAPKCCWLCLSKALGGWMHGQWAGSSGHYGSSHLAATRRSFQAMPCWVPLGSIRWFTEQNNLKPESFWFL